MKLALLGVLFLSLAATGCAKDLITGKKTYNWFSLKTDVKLGRQVMGSQLQALKEKEKTVDKKADPRMFRKVKRISEKIAKISHVPDFPWEVHLADVDVVNAWCAPGGKIMVYSGLYEHKKALVNRHKTDELAAVLGHEIAHATARHVTESLSRNYSVLFIGQAAMTAISASGSGLATNIFNEVYVQGINLFVPAYSRKNESEADRIGLFYMARAGYNPQAAVDLWYRACKQKGDRLSVYASHPSSCQRAKNLETLLPQATDLYRQVKRGKKLPAPPEVPQFPKSQKS